VCTWLGVGRERERERRVKETTTVSAAAQRNYVGRDASYKYTQGPIREGACPGLLGKGEGVLNYHDYFCPY